jgi:hypothetical protein
MGPTGSTVICTSGHPTQTPPAYHQVLQPPMHTDISATVDLITTASARHTACLLPKTRTRPWFTSWLPAGPSPDRPHWSRWIWTVGTHRKWEIRLHYEKRTYGVSYRSKIIVETDFTNTIFIAVCSLTFTVECNSYVNSNHQCCCCNKLIFDSVIV